MQNRMDRKYLEDSHLFNPNEHMEGYKSLSIKELCRRSHNLAKEKGFWDSGIKREMISEKIALMHSELSEMLECYRANEKDLWFKENGKPEGLCAEAADLAIRLFDFCAAFEIDLESAIEIKHKFNTSRPYKHGKTC